MLETTRVAKKYKKLIIVLGISFVSCVSLAVPQVADKRPVTIKLSDGQLVYVARDSLTPPSKDILLFTAETMIKLFAISASSSEPGISIDGNSKVSLSTWNIRTHFAKNIRQPLLKEMAKLTPQDTFKFKNNGKHFRLVIQHLFQPKQIALDQWTVDIFSRITETNGSIRIPFNKTVFVHYPNLEIYDLRDIKR